MSKRVAILFNEPAMVPTIKDKVHKRWPDAIFTEVTELVTGNDLLVVARRALETADIIASDNLQIRFFPHRYGLAVMSVLSESSRQFLGATVAREDLAERAEHIMRYCQMDLDALQDFITEYNMADAAYFSKSHVGPFEAIGKAFVKIAREKLQHPASKNGESTS